MIIRGNKRPGINARNSEGGPVPMIFGGGQSNFQNGTPIVATDLEVAYQQIFHNILFYKYSVNRSLKFEPMNWLDNTTYADPAQTGQFAQQFYLYTQLATHFNRSVYFATYGIGDTALAVDWKPTATIGPLFTEMIFKLQQAKRGAFARDGINPLIKFFLWDQGEKDGRVLADANNYQTNMTNFITQVRTLTGEANLPFLLCKFNPDIANAPVNPVTYWATINTAKDNVAGAMTNVKVVESDNATMDTDKIHYTTAGYLQKANNAMAVAIANGYI